ncbi:MAG TPA: hypothetical protein VHO48_03010 [Anaerolineaceae bacterium]|jgi:two-component system chemotaxis response regulator CheB|nr:hypothetical protein [Anaerolineaceae bacterium]
MNKNDPAARYHEDETNLIRNEISDFEKGNGRDSRSVLTYPDCGGVLSEIQDEQMIRYRCHVGHIYEADSLLLTHDEKLENAFWTAVRWRKSSSTRAEPSRWPTSAFA